MRTISGKWLTKTMKFGEVQDSQGRKCYYMNGLYLTYWNKIGWRWQVGGMDNMWEYLHIPTQDQVQKLLDGLRGLPEAPINLDHFIISGKIALGTQPTDGAITFGLTPPVWDSVIEDMKKRDQFGTKKYGMPLFINDGRDTLQDAYEEALDLAVYLKKAILERADADKKSQRQDIHLGGVQEKVEVPLKTPSQESSQAHGKETS